MNTISSLRRTRRGRGTSAIVLSGLTLLACAPTKPPRPEPERATRSGLEPAAQSIKDVMEREHPLYEAAVMVSEADFQSLLDSSGPKGVSEQLRRHAATAVGEAADQLALGVFGTPATSPTEVSADIFVVAKDAALSPDGDIEAKRFFVAAVHLQGTVSWAATVPRLAVLGAFPRGRCRDAFRGCKGIFGDRPDNLRSHQFASADEQLAGLPRETTANFESATGPANASGQWPTLRLFSGHSAVPNEFGCHLPVEWAQCEPAFVPGTPLPTGESVDLPGDAIILDERDFLVALRDNDPDTASVEARLAGVQLSTVANADNRLGLRAHREGGGSFEGEFFVVVRNPVLDGDFIEARHFYFAAVKLRGEANWLASSGGLLFEPPRPANLDFGPCGPVSMTEEGPRCDMEDCLPMPPVPIQPNQPLFGNNRWPGASRVTLRLPNSLIPTRDITTFACARWQPTPPLNPCGAIGEAGQSFTETCNGVDDNCNGEVDENDACANRTVCVDGCKTRSCQQQGVTCGTTADGCGGMWTCGGACP